MIGTFLLPNNANLRHSATNNNQEKSLKEEFSFSGNYTSVDEIIKDLEQNSNNIINLHIKGKKITENLWKAICKCTNLEILYLHNCQFISLPPTIESLKNLKVLNLSNSTVKFLSPKLGSLDSLEILDVSNTQVKSLSEEIIKLERLRELILTNCPVKSLPKNKWNMPQLEVLNLNGLMIKELPPGMSKLNKLRVLDISHTDVKDLETLDHLKKIEDFNASGTGIITLPENLVKSIKSLTLIGCNLLSSNIRPFREKQARKELIFIS